MKTLGVLLLAAGAVVTWVLGQNYGLCRQWWIDSSQYACRVADAYHGWGIVLMIAGAVSLAVGCLRWVNRREAERAKVG